MKQAGKLWLTLCLVLCGIVLIMTPAWATVNISSQGSFQYTIPLKLPDGTAGMAPDLSIQYDSQNQNGMLGLGFFLSGLSSISRDSRYPTKFDSTDHYTLDNERLVYNPTTGYYHTERETYFRIQSVNPDTPASYWVVTHKDGMKYYYGYRSGRHTTANDGHIDAVGKYGQALVWALSRVEDTHGNYYSIFYQEDSAGGDFYPQQFVYTSNDNAPLAGEHTVDLIYEARADKMVMYNPTLISMDQRLKWIEIKMGSTLVRKYRLDYDASPATSQSRLSACQEYGADGTSTLPAITFNWRSNNVSFSSTSGPSHYVINNTSGAGVDLARVSFGDFNGDGLTDVYQVNGYGSSAYASIYFYRKDGTYSTATGPSHWIAGDTGIARTDVNRVQFGDFNGDGITDVYHINGFDSTTPATIYLFNGSGTYRAVNGPSHNIYGGNSGAEIDVSRIKFGDFNGDGITDVYQINGWGTMAAATIYLMKADGTWTTVNGPYHNIINVNEGARNDIKRIQMGDFNGDGITDVYQINGYGSTAAATIYLFNTDGTYRTVSGPSHMIYGSNSGAA
ncbi:MAG TPA: FG-GAP-like repeat-containing protein, partial [Bacillota bacterium]|nr:FG-GAP-like repeat-containing protein [Bacillota bacterium]